MTSYKDPSFQDRVGSATKAKNKALEQLRAKPPVDEKIAAERLAAHAQRKAKTDEKAAIKKASATARNEAEAAAKAAEPAIPSEAEQKAARDARYAARKSRR